jgi:hypothetical protein
VVPPTKGVHGYSFMSDEQRRTVEMGSTRSQRCPPILRMCCGYCNMDKTRMSEEHSHLYMGAQE